MEDDILSDVVPSNIVSRQVCCPFSKVFLTELMHGLFPAKRRFRGREREC